MAQFIDGVKYTDVMVDIETTGTYPDRAAIVQIGARRFNIKTGEVDKEFFKTSTTMLKGRQWERETVDWWATKVPKVIRDEVFSDNALNIEVAMNLFADWAYPTNSLQMWAKPTHFDFMFIASHFRDLNIINPFHFRYARDVNSYVDGLYRSGEIPDVEYVDPAKTGAHDAMNDVDSQINYLLAHYDNTK